MPVLLCTRVSNQRSVSFVQFPRCVNVVLLLTSSRDHVASLYYAVLLCNSQAGAAAALLASSWTLTVAHLQAIRLGDAATAIKLLERGASDTVLGPSGYGALHYAAHFDQPALASVLIQRGADLERANSVTGQTPLYIAARGGAVSVHTPF